MAAIFEIQLGRKPGLNPARTYVFDVDGVVVKPWGFADVLLDEFGLTKEDTRAFFSGPFQDCLTGDLTLESVLPEYLEAWSCGLSVDAFVSLWMTSDDRPDRDVLELVSQLRANDYSCHIASNQEAIRAKYLETDMGFAGIFEGCHFSCELGARKPQDEFYARTHRRLGVPKAEVNYWDDEAGNVQAAARFGWNAFLFEGVRSIADVVQPRAD